MVSEFDANRPIFNPIAPETITSFNLVIADEASMINKNLFELIFDKVANKHTKVLFIGDECYLRLCIRNLACRGSFACCRNGKI